MDKRTLLIFITSGILIIFIIGLLVVFLNRTDTTQEMSAGTPSFFSRLFGTDNPIDDMISFVTGNNVGTNTTTENTGETTLPLLRQIHPLPVSGATFITMSRIGAEGKTESVLGVRVMERSSGNILDIPLDGSNTLRITNTTFPGVEQLYWDGDVSHMFARHLDVESGIVTNTFLKVIPGKEDVTGTEEDESQGSLSATLFPQQILSATSSPDGKKLFTLTSTSSGSEGSTLPIDGTGVVKKIFSSPLREWLIEWTRNDTIYLSTKPSSGIPGYAYMISSTNGGRPEKIVGNIPGLTIHMSPVAHLGLIGSAEKKSFFLSLFSKGILTDMGFDTLPEKCAWTENGARVYCGVPIFPEPAPYPDAWYKGLVSFTDAIWYANIETGEYTLLADTGAYDTPPLDIIHISVSPNGQFLLFTNKNDGTPWIFEITKQ